MSDDRVTLAHGGGGLATENLIKSVFKSCIDHPVMDWDSGVIDPTLIKNGMESGLVVSTDSFIVWPVFFSGGNIGKLAACGSLNDVSVMGARPKFLTVSWMIEEGFKIEDLKKLASSLTQEVAALGARIISGDTKVVPKGKMDGVFVTTTCIGELHPDSPFLPTGQLKQDRHFEPGDVIIVSGSVGDHGIAIYNSRSGIGLDSGLASDVGCVFELIWKALEVCPKIKLMRDPTRGGLATTLCEWIDLQKKSIEIDQTQIPVLNEVRASSEILGFDPLYLSNEGRVVLVVPKTYAERVLLALKCHPFGRGAQIIGQVIDQSPPRLILKTELGSRRILTKLSGEILPRIC